MLGGDETVTLIQQDGDGYRCTAVEGASWFAKTAAAISAEGVKPVNTLKVRIPDGRLPKGVIPATGNYLARGTLTELHSLSDLQEVDYFKVTAVGDNRRGNLKHWAVSGA